MCAWIGVFWGGQIGRTKERLLLSLYSWAIFMAILVQIRISSWKILYYNFNNFSRVVLIIYNFYLTRSMLNTRLKCTTKFEYASLKYGNRDYVHYNYYASHPVRPRDTMLVFLLIFIIIHKNSS